MTQQYLPLFIYLFIHLLSKLIIYIIKNYIKHCVEYKYIICDNKMIIEVKIYSTSY